MAWAIAVGPSGTATTPNRRRRGSAAPDSSPMTTIGISITGPVAPQTLPGVLERSVQLGFDEIWVSETFFGGGALTTAAFALARTDLPVGFSALSTAVRHPAALAMES